MKGQNIRKLNFPRLFQVRCFFYNFFHHKWLKHHRLWWLLSFCNHHNDNNKNLMIYLQISAVARVRLRRSLRTSFYWQVIARIFRIPFNFYQVARSSVPQFKAVWQRLRELFLIRPLQKIEWNRIHIVDCVNCNSLWAYLISKNLSRKRWKRYEIKIIIKIDWCNSNLISGNK